MQAPQKEATPIDPDARKQCRKCREQLALTEFFKNARNDDGLQSWCKVCMGEYRRERDHREAEKAEHLAEAAKHLAIVRQQGRDSLGQDVLEDQLAAKVTELRLDAGFSRKQIAEGLNMTMLRVDGLLARAKRLAWNAESREDIRHWAMLQYEEQMELARAEKNLTEARLAIGDMLKAAGIVSTGGNTMNVGIVGGGSRFEERVEALLKQEMIEGEVIEDVERPSETR